MVLIFLPFFPLPGLILYFILRPRETLAEIYERSLEEEALLQGIEERLACPGCNRRIEEGFMICPTCHTRLKKACPSCEQLLHLRWNICPYCGAVQTTAKAPPSPTPEPQVEQAEPPPQAPQPSPEPGLSESAETIIVKDEPEKTVEVDLEEPEGGAETLPFAFD
jgi:RNA polymerase subunit RPABC4/transcription elongation factor Spt4